MIKPEDIRQLSKLSAFESTRSIIQDWLLIAANFVLAIYFPHPAVWVCCFILAARQQLALAILLHDGAHRRLYTSVKLNDYICQFFCSSPLFFSMYSYQKLHLQHHRNPLVDDDPDLSLIGGYPVSKKSLFRKIARDAFGISYLKFIRYYIHMPRKKKPIASEAKPQSTAWKIPMPVVVASMLAVNFAIWFALYQFHAGWYYFFLWFLPQVTALQVLLRVRGIAEHAGYSPNADQRLNARTVVNPVQTFFFAPHNVNYHIEHHIYPSVPSYHLPKLHRLFKEQNLHPEKNIYYGYGQVLKELTLKTKP